MADGNPRFTSSAVHDEDLRESPVAADCVPMPSLADLAAQVVADHPALILSDPSILDTLPEEDVGHILALIMSKLKLTVPLAKAFAACKHARVAEAMDGLDLYKAVGAYTAGGCRR